MPRLRNWLAVFLLATVLGFSALAQQPPQGGAQNGAQAPQAPAAQPAQLPPDTIRANYVLGPNDQILIREPQAEEINEKPFRIDADGNINLPLLGRLHVAGMTYQELEADLDRRLREYIRQPQVIVTVTQFRSEPVFFVGAFRAPGIYPLQGRRTLVEMLTAVGGLGANASRHITLTRREEYGPIPLPNAIVDSAKKVSTVEISLGSLRENVNPAEDVLLQPYDVISVSRAELVYISGEVARTGGIELGERDSISILQALIQAGGLTRDASKGDVLILRPVVNTNRRAVIHIDAKRVFEGKDLDVPLLPNDVLYVPRSYTPVIARTFGQLTLGLVPVLIFLATQ